MKQATEIYDLTELLPRLPKPEEMADFEEFGEAPPDGLARLLLTPIRSRDTEIPDWISRGFLTVIVILIAIFAFAAARKFEAAQWERPVRVQVTEKR